MAIRMKAMAQKLILLALWALIVSHTLAKIIQQPSTKPPYQKKHYTYQKSYHSLPPKVQQTQYVPHSTHSKPYPSHSKFPISQTKPSTSYIRSSASHVQPSTSHIKHSPSHFKPPPSHVKPSTSHAKHSSSKHGTSYVQTSTNGKPSASHAQPSTTTTHAKAPIVTSYTKKGYVPVHVPVNVPMYEFGYKVHDPENKNYQEKTETRLGDAVQGYYSLLEPNGEVRVVRYQSDDSGFHSKVTLHKNKEKEALQDKPSDRFARD